MKKLINVLLLAGFILFCTIILGLALRGNKGNPDAKTLNTIEWSANGPFELSPERGRFALTYSMIEDKSFYFSEPIARFAAPDVGTINGHYVSLFAPLVSFIVVPGYLLGKMFGIGQVGAYSVIALFAILNVILIRLISVRLGVGKLPATIGSLLFLFATPAFTYAVNLYQHHISTFLILCSIYLLLKTERIWGLLIIFFLCALSIPLDYPNLFLMAPIGIYALSRIIYLKKDDVKTNLNINLPKFLTIFIVIIPILFFLWFNKSSYGNPLQFSGAVQTAEFSNERISNLDLNRKIIEEKKAAGEGTDKSVIGFFRTRALLEGFYIHFISPDRGVIYFAPVVLFGIAGLLLAVKKKIKMTAVLVGVIGANILLYSMWTDPWGGWAFGSRYLIPTYAILSIFTAQAIFFWGRRILFIIPFIIVSFYSIAINTLGAITTSAIPPKVEVLALEALSGSVQKYNFLRNWDFLLGGNSKSFVFQSYLENYISSVVFYGILTVIICLVVGSITFYYYLISRKGGNVNV